MIRYLYVLVIFSVVTFGCNDNLEDSVADPAVYQKMDKLYVSAKENISDPEKALEEAKQLLTLAQQENSLKYVGEASNIIGSINRDQEDYVAALKNFRKSAEAFETSQDTAGMAKIYNNIGNIYRDILRYDDALSFYQKSLTAKTLLGDKEGMAITNRNMAYVLQLKGEYQKAKDSYWTSLYTWKALKNEDRMAQIYNDLGIVYDLIAKENNDAVVNDEIEKNIIFNLYKNSLELYQKVNNQKGIGWAYNNIAILLIEKEKYEEALGYLNKTMALKGRSQDQEGLTRTYNHIGIIYLNYQNDPDQAISYFRQAEKYAQAEELQRTYENLASALEKKGQFTDAIVYFRKLTKLKDMLRNDRHRQEIAKIEARYSVEYAGL